MSSERKKPKDILGDIDDLLGENKAEPENVFKPVTYDEVRRFTDSINARGIDAEKNELTGLKDFAVNLLRGSVCKYFAGEEDFKKVRSELSALHEAYKKTYPDDTGYPDSDTVYMGQDQRNKKNELWTKVRQYRNQVLTNILATDPLQLPDNLKEPTVEIQHRYAQVYESFQARISGKKIGGL